MLPAIPTYLTNHEAVLQAFGLWPNFHDGYLLAFQLKGDVFECEIHGWNMTSKLDERGFYVCDQHHRVRFRFEGLHDVHLEGLEACVTEFGTNILWELGLTPPTECSHDGAFEVRVESTVGDEFTGWFRARHGEVLAVLPCDPKGQCASPSAL